MTLKFPTFFVTSLALALSASAEEKKVDFGRDIRPLLSNSCFLCHGPDPADRKGGGKDGFRIDTLEGSREDLGGYFGIVPGKPEESEIYLRMTNDDPDESMPPPKHGKKLPPEAVELMRRWIAEGAEYAGHWSYVKPVKAPVPMSGEGWAKNEIDHFIHARLDSENLKPSPEADRATLIRRVSLDITGLPPTLEEVERFKNDARPDAYERLVDDLLARSSYGEHWARKWLDLARYADSAGYADDPERTIWAYRDYVIRALNENRPYDEFTIEQLAGDLLENPTMDQLIATAFHRNTQTNSEGGTDDEEYRNVAIVDRVNTTMEVWMGTTMACAQCHTHKYDPITQEEYFKFFAILNNSEDADRRNEEPFISVFSAEQESRKKTLEEKIVALESKLSLPTPEALAAMKKWETSLSGEDRKWMSVSPVSASATSGATFTRLEDGSYLVSGKAALTDTYTLEVMTGAKAVTGLKLEVLAHESLGGKGPGRQSNFVLNEIEIVGGLDSKSTTGRYVRVELPGKDKTLHLAEVEVFDALGKNVALSGKATQSSQYLDAVAGRANDGNTDGDYFKGSVNHTAVGDKAAYWEVDLEKAESISKIVIWNRTDGTTQNRLSGVKLVVLDVSRNPVWERKIDKVTDRMEFSVDGGQTMVFTHASSSFDQSEFAAAAAIDGNDNSHSGWAVGPQIGKDHHAVFEFGNPLPGGRLQITLKQTYGDHAIGRFRISVTDESGPLRAMPHAIAAVLAIPESNRTPAQNDALFAHYSDLNPSNVAARAEIAALKSELQGIKPGTTVPIMRELPENKQRITNLQYRGSFLDKGQEVGKGVPAAFHPLKGEPNRLTMAKWLVDRENPLTARVLVNRAWEAIFGHGIVLTSEEFGSQGELPVHPELLDWLAVDTMEKGWDTKRLLRQIVTSAAYRQSSKVDDALSERDPDNRLLARGPRFRLSAETIRDQALALSGLLSHKMYGAPVRPMQPSLGLKAAFGGGTDWNVSDGEDRYRRGIYTNWRRSSPYPSMAAFDAPSREVCTIRRDRTNTPLQALVTLNDPVYIEAAQALARKIASTPGTVSEQAAYAFKHCTGRDPVANEVKAMVSLLEKMKANYTADMPGAKAMAEDPLGPIPAGVDAVELAAWTVLGNVLLNLDEMLMKR